MSHTAQDWPIGAAVLQSPHIEGGGINHRPTLAPSLCRPALEPAPAAGSDGPVHAEGVRP
ncbi:hypothetical protein ACIRQP_28485 [Streptomyces sp. NPDC102274]|uniref:hypothetical protein n=1 Tax=Streptomyces sp. NPDC102274 TaxID=3366151 RepID=UPI00382F83EA